MLCDAPGCKNPATHSGTLMGGDRLSHSFNLCDKHLPIDLKAQAEVGTTIVERGAIERIELPADHPLVKESGAVVNTTNASGTTGLTGDTEEAKVARTKLSDEASPNTDVKIKADTKVKEPTQV